MFKIKSVPVLLCLCTSLAATALSAQSIWINQNQGSSLAIEFLKPKFDGDDPFTFLSSALFFSGRFSIGENTVFVGELPVAYAKLDGDFGSSDSELAVGNPYVGLELRKAGSSTFGEVGVRVPIAPDDKFTALAVGVAADLDRFEAFAPDVVTILGRINFQNTNASNLGVRVRGGPTLLINTKGNGDDAELLINYSAQVGYDGQQVTIMGGLTGRFVVTEDGNLGERSFHQLGVSAILTSSKIQPGAHIRFPLDDDLSQILDFVFGLNLAINLNK